MLYLSGENECSFVDWRLHTKLISVLWRALRTILVMYTWTRTRLQISSIFAYLSHEMVSDPHTRQEEHEGTQNTVVIPDCANLSAVMISAQRL